MVALQLTVVQLICNENGDPNILLEHVNSSVKRCRIVKDRMRLWMTGVRNLVMDIYREVTRWLHVQ